MASAAMAIRSATRNPSTRRGRQTTLNRVRPRLVHAGRRVLVEPAHDASERFRRSRCSRRTKRISPTGHARRLDAVLALTPLIDRHDQVAIDHPPRHGPAQMGLAGPSSMSGPMPADGVHRVPAATKDHFGRGPRGPAVRGSPDASDARAAPRTSLGPAVGATSSSRAHPLGDGRPGGPGSTRPMPRAAAPAACPIPHRHRGFDSIGKTPGGSDPWRSMSL